MPGLVPGIHDLACVGGEVDGRDKPGHDGESKTFANYSALLTSFIRGSDRSFRLRYASR
jgi:hypothetical protein